MQEGLETRVTVKKKVVNATATETKVNKIRRLKNYPKKSTKYAKNKGQKMHLKLHLLCLEPII